MFIVLKHRRKSFRASAAATNDNFEFTVTTTTSGETFTIPCQNVGTFNATVDWGDGSATSTITAYNDADLTHNYATSGDHDIIISGTFPNIYFSNAGDKLKVKSVTNLGSVGWTTLNNAFFGCSNMTSFTPGDCDTSSVTTLSSIFQNCTSLTSLDLSSFNTSSVTNMGNMFTDCTSLTSLDVSSFNTSNVTNISGMFDSCSFTSLDLSNFNTSSVTNMNSLFRDCSSLTSVDLSSFDTSSVGDGMNFMFEGCSSLTSLDLSSFDTSSVTGMKNMFYGMGGGSAQLTITGIEDFNITSLEYDFLLGIVHVGGFHQGLDNTGGISTTVYDELLVNWEAQTGYATDINAHFGPSKYSANSTAATARADLVTTGWVITDGGSIDFATAGMTLDATWSTIGTNYAHLDNATSASAKVYCNFDKDDTGIIMEAGGAVHGLILYIHNETLYFQCGESATAGGDSDTGEVSYTVTNTTAQDFIIEWSADTSGCALYVDKTLIGTDVFSNSVLSGTNDGTIGQVESAVAVNRGSSGSFTGTVTKAEIFLGEVTSDVSGL